MELPRSHLVLRGLKKLARTSASLQMNLSVPLRSLLLALPVSATAQHLEPPLEAPEVSAPSGYYPSPILPTHTELLQGIDLGLSSSFVYDSNVNPGAGGSSNQGDFILTLSPSVAYRTVGGDWYLGGHAALNHSTYFEQSDLGGIGYNGGLDFGYQGHPLTVRGSIGTSLVQGVNRYYGGYSETQNFTSSLSASYQWSAKTSIDARMSYRMTEPDQKEGSSTARNFGGSESLDFDLSAMWRASPLLSVGPGIAWSHDTGDSKPERESIGPIIRLKYQLSNKVSADGTFGIQFTDYDGGSSSDPLFTTRLGVNYRASSLWGMNLSVYQGASADGAGAGDYRENLSVRLGYNRRIRRAAVALGVGYETNDIVNTGSTSSVATGNARDFLTLNASIGMPMFHNRVQASTFFQLREQAGDGGTGGSSDTDGYKVGLSFSTSF